VTGRCVASARHSRGINGRPAPIPPHSAGARDRPGSDPTTVRSTCASRTCSPAAVVLCARPPSPSGHRRGNRRRRDRSSDQFLHCCDLRWSVLTCSSQRRFCSRKSRSVEDSCSLAPRARTRNAVRRFGTPALPTAAGNWLRHLHENPHSFRPRVLSARAAGARKPRRYQRTRMKGLPGSRWLSETVGDHQQRGRVKAEPDMGGVDLDVLALLALPLQTGTPGDHAVGADVDRRRGDRNRLRRPAHPLGSWRPLPLPSEKSPDSPDIGRTRCRDRASQRNDHARVVRDLTWHLSRDDATTAPTDEAHTSPVVLPKLPDLRGNRGEISGRRTNVATAPPAVDLIAQGFEKTADRDGRSIVSPEPRQHHHRMRLSTRRIDSATSPGPTAT
jgi:hypothetical protein